MSGIVPPSSVKGHSGTLAQASLQTPRPDDRLAAMARHLMEPDPDAGAPSLLAVLWMIVVVLAFVLMVALVAPAT